MPYRVRLKPAAARDLRALQRRDQRRVARTIDQLAQDPRPRGCSKLTGGSELYRIRVGQFRILYQVKDEQVMVLIVRVGHRRDVYR